MDAMQKIVDKDLPPGFRLHWAGHRTRTAVGRADHALLMVLSIVVVFPASRRCNESRSVPVFVLLVVPIGILGAVLLSMLGVAERHHFKIGLITVIGPAAKNAILTSSSRSGTQRRQAAGAGGGRGGQLRLRPIPMTSLAFIARRDNRWRFPAAPANARHAIGTGA